MIILTILIILAIILLVWQISNLISILSGSLYVKTDHNLILFALKKAGLKKNDVFYDLGSGCGDVIIAASIMGVKAYGVEISPFYYLYSKLKTFLKPNIRIFYGDIRKVNLKNVDIVYCYLLPNFLKALKTKLLSVGPKKIISIGFEINGLPNGKIYHYKNKKIYIYSLRSCSA